MSTHIMFLWRNEENYHLIIIKYSFLARPLNYPGKTTITKHSPPEKSEEEEMMDKQLQDTQQSCKNRDTNKKNYSQQKNTKN